MHWRETYKPARFFFLDARAGVPILLTLLHFRPWTLFFSCAVIAIFWLLERKGMTLPSALRALRAWAIGDARPGLPFHKIRGRIDYERRFDEDSERRITLAIRPAKARTRPAATAATTAPATLKGKAART